MDQDMEKYTKTWRHGNVETWRHGHGDMKKWRNGDIRTWTRWRHRDMNIET